MKEFSTRNIKYKRLKKYWKHFLRPYKLLNTKYFFKLVHLPSKFISDEAQEEAKTNIVFEAKIIEKETSSRKI